MATLNDLRRTDSGTNTVLRVASLYHMSSGTPAAGLGASFGLGAENSNSEAVDGMEWQGNLTTVTDGAEVGQAVLRIMSAGSLASVLTVAPTSATWLDDTDAAFIFGRARIAAPTSDYAHFSHRDMSAAASYALAQGATGATYLNAASGQTINFHINNVPEGQWSATNFAIGSASTDTVTLTSRLLVRTVTDAGPMTATGGTQREIVWNTSDSKLYVCTVTGTPGTWVALH